MLRVGQIVKLAHYTSKAIILERRGPLGPKGVQVYRLAWHPEEEDPDYSFELPEDFLKPVRSRKRAQ